MAARKVAYMNTYNLYVFCKCFEVGNFTQVAAELRISQPAVSQHVRNLERFFGVKLFERHRNKIAPTDAGRAVYQFAKHHLMSLESLKGQLNDFKKGSRGRIILGASLSMGRYRLPRILAAFKQRYDDVEIQLVIERRDRVAQMVQEGLLDLGYILSVGPRPGLVVKSVGWEPQVVVAAPDHPAAQKGQLDKHELACYPVVTLLRDSLLMRILEEQLRQAGIADLQVAAEFGDPEGLKRAVAAGLGIAFVYRSEVELELRVGLLTEVPVVGLELGSRVDIVFRQDKYVHPAMERLVEMLMVDGPFTQSQSPTQ